MVELKARTKQSSIRGELHYAFQPIYDTQFHIVGYEALARCQFFSERGEAIKVQASAEGIERVPYRTQVYAFVRSVLRFKQAYNIDPALPVSFNIDPVNFTAKKLAVLIETAKQSGMPLDSLAIEITEHHEIKNIHQGLVMEVADLGIDIRLDDFGTGFSNIESLMSLPFTTVKFDKSFLYMYKNSLAMSLMQSMHSAIRAHGINTILEGIETPEMLDVAKYLEPTGLQGWLLSREQIAPNTETEEFECQA